MFIHTILNAVLTFRAALVPKPLDGSCGTVLFPIRAALVISDLTLLASKENLGKSDGKSAEALKASGRSKMSAISGSTISGISFVTQGQLMDDGVKVGDLVLLHHSQIPFWPCTFLQDPYFGPYRIIRMNGSRIHVRILCAPKQLRHFHFPHDLSWDEWRLTDKEVERVDLQKAASLEEADKLKEMTAEEIAVDGYCVVAGIARQEYKQGWKFLTL